VKVKLNFGVLGGLGLLLALGGGEGSHQRSTHYVRAVGKGNFGQ
jgi:hypothetical protein